MATPNSKALTFDTGGTILDWLKGLASALEALGAAHRFERDWHALANEVRKRSLAKVVNLNS